MARQSERARMLAEMDASIAEQERFVSEGEKALSWMRLMRAGWDAPAPAADKPKRQRKPKAAAPTGDNGE